MLEPFLLAVAVAAGQSAPAVNTTADVHPCGPPIEVESQAGEHGQVRWITSLPLALTTPPPQLRGRHLSLRDVRVERVDDRGFWIGAGDSSCRLYVTPAEGGLVHVTPGEFVDLQGEFRFRIQQRGRDSSRANAYVYAYVVRKAPEARRSEPR